MTLKGLFQHPQPEAEVAVTLVKDLHRADRACRVEYRNPPPLHSIGQPDPLMMSMDAVEHLGLDRAVESHIAQHWKELFFVKARDWEQEGEVL